MPALGGSFQFDFDEDHQRFMRDVAEAMSARRDREIEEWKRIDADPVFGRTPEHSTAPDQGTDQRQEGR